MDTDIYNIIDNFLKTIIRNPPHYINGNAMVDVPLIELTKFERNIKHLKNNIEPEVDKTDEYENSEILDTDFLNCIFS